MAIASGTFIEIHAEAVSAGGAPNCFPTTAQKHKSIQLKSKNQPHLTKTARGGPDSGWCRPRCFFLLFFLFLLIGMSIQVVLDTPQKNLPIQLSKNDRRRAAPVQAICD